MSWVEIACAAAVPLLVVFMVVCLCATGAEADRAAGELLDLTELSRGKDLRR